MMRISRSPLAILVFALLIGATNAQEPIRLARTPDISPDGKFVAFSYLGDIWVVETIGGTARAVTSHPAHDLAPVFSPDGRKIAFSSNRHGSYDVYVVPVQGGHPTRLTFDSATDQVCGWTPDGKQILFASTRGTSFPVGYELFTVPVQGGPSRRITAAEGKEGVFSPTGDRLAYVRGPGTWYRKGYRGSSNDDIWLCNADGGNNRRVTAFNGQDNSPMWSADGKTLFYVSEIHGTPANIVRLPLDSTAVPAAGKLAVKPQSVTTHKDDGVRRARISSNGAWIVYECGADLWVISTHEGSTPRKLAIEVNADDKTNPEQLKIFTSGATEFSLSADEKFMAFAVHGKLFRINVGPGAKVVQMTNGSANDHNAAWAPDGSKIIFISDREGHEDLYLLEADDEEHPKFTEAHRFKVKQLTNTPDAEFGVSFAPNGKRVAFLRAGKLWTMNPDGSDPKAIVSDVQVFDYEWSPDSKWFVYARRDGSFASELFIVPATGATADNPARNITRYATYNGDVTWSHDGKHIAFLSDRRGEANLYVLPLHKPAAPGFTERSPLLGKSVSIDWEDIHLRAKSAAPVRALTGAISPDGSKIAFRDAKDNDLWVASSNGGQLTRLTTGHAGPRQIVWSKPRSALSSVASDIIYYLDQAGAIHLVRASGGSGPALPFRIKMRVRTADQYLEMFDQSWRYLSEHFYDSHFHGSDWNAIRAKYRPLLKYARRDGTFASHVAMKEDLYALLYLMMGELNASHLGVYGVTSSPDETTADLGLIFDEGYRGRGWKIAEVLKRGPADRRGLNLKAGDLILNIDGVEVNDATVLSKELNGKSGERVTLQVATKPEASSKERRRVEVTAVSRRTITPLMYDRWVERNARRVADISKGKLGYIHIPSMDEDGLDRFVRSLYSDNYDKEAIVLDVRFNGGGFTHDQILNYLGSHEHTIFKQRDGGQGLVLRSHDRKWNKPLVLLINNRSYSDAEIFPNAFRTLGLGKLVGQPTGGYVIGTGQVSLIDGTIFRIPRIGVYTTKGVNMDKEGVQPDVAVDTHPDQLAKGVDAQLDKAVEVLQADVLAWKKKNQASVVSKPGGSGPVTPMVSPTPMVPLMPPAK
ncbi:MAG TPA: S41 family peptidase [Gemmataceae bacterium]|nr:S41 family peptidase [Gemmataceae bacterium]